MAGTIDGGAGRATPVPPLSDAVRAADAAAVDARPVRPSDRPSDAPVDRDRDRPFTADEDADAGGHWGLFGPGTVTWRIHSDPLIGLAVLRSLALRVLHPEGLS